MFFRINGYLFVLIICCNAIDGELFRFDYHYGDIARGWFKLHKVPANWKDARLKCFREGGVLASPETPNMWTTMTNLLKNEHFSPTCGVFTGIHATYSKGYYFSIEGTPLDRMPVQWAPDEPDNADDKEDCLIMLANGTLADVNCSEAYPYMCFRKINSKSALNNCGTVDNDYVLEDRTGSCYKFHAEPQVWPRAFAACAGEGGHLAIINSDTEAEVLKGLFAKHPPESMPGNFIKIVVHLGHNDWGEHGLWMTIHGQTLKDAGYDKWAPGQPDNPSSQYCGAMFRDGKLDDMWCDRPCPFICEKKPNSLLTDDSLH